MLQSKSRNNRNAAAHFQFLSKRPFVGVVLVLGILAQSVVIYHIAFRDWQGPGDFGKNYNYVPAIMIGAGHGFQRVTQETIEATPALNAFLEFETTRLAPAVLPAELPTQEAFDEDKWYQYMLFSVGIVWRVFGISWNVVRVMFVVLLAINAWLVYRISRLLVPTWWSLLVAHAFVWNDAVLGSMYSFRDFSKATFILAVVLILCGMIKTPPGRWRYLGNAALIGIILGVGLGFRRDMQVILIITLPIYLLCQIRGAHSILWRVAAVSVAVAVFVGVGFPVLQSFYPHRALNTHDSIMGFASYSDRQMNVLRPASYEKHYLQNDMYCIYRVLAWSRYGNWGPWEESRAVGFVRETMSPFQSYLIRTVSLFPADVLARAYASVLRSCTGVVGVRLPLLHFFDYFGVVFVLLGLTVIAVRRPFQAWHVVLLLCFFCGYTSIQYGVRHAFHTSFIPYLFGCFFLHRCYRTFRWARETQARLSIGQAGKGLLRGALWLSLTGLVFLLPLRAAQYIQDRQVAALVKAHQDAPRIPRSHSAVPDGEGYTLLRPVHPNACRGVTLPRDIDWMHSVEVLVYVARFSATAAPLEIDLDYDYYGTGDDLNGPALSHTREGTPTGEIDFYFPVYKVLTGDNWSVFNGIRLPSRQADGFLGFEQVMDVERLGYFLNLTLPENHYAFVGGQALSLPGLRLPEAHVAYRDPARSTTNVERDIQNLLKRGQPSEAIALLQPVLMQRPDSIQFNTLLAEAYFKETGHEDFWHTVDMLLEKHAGRGPLYRRLDLLFAALGGADMQYEGWRSIFERHGASPCVQLYFEEALFVLAESLLAAPDFPRYRTLMQAHPNNQRLAFLGDAWLAKNTALDMREEFWQQMIAAQPTATMPRLLLGRVLEEAEKHAEAAAAYVAAFEINERHPEIAIRFATLLRPDFEPEAAMRIIESALQSAPGLATLVLERLERSGDRAASYGEYVMAETYYRVATRRLAAALDSERGARLRFRPAEMLAKQGHLDQAIHEMRRLLAACPGGYMAAHPVDMTLATYADKEARIAFWRQIVSEQPASAAPWIYLGDALSASKRFGEAAEAYQTAGMNGSTQIVAAIRLITLPDTAMTETARLRNAERIVRDTPENAVLLAKAFRESAYHYSQREDHEHAARFHAYSARYYHHASQGDPHNPWVCLDYAFALLSANKLEEARAVMLELPHDDIARQPEIALRLRTELFILGEAPDSQRLDLYIKKHHPQKAQAIQGELIGRAHRLSEAGSHEAAERLVRMAVAIHSETEWAWTALGGILEEVGDQPGALKAYREGLAHADTIGDLIALFRALLERMRYPESAIADAFQEVIEMRQEALELYMQQARALEAQERWHDAVDVYHEALERFDNAPEPALRLGLAYLRLGKINPAIGLIEQAAAADHTVRDAALHDLLESARAFCGETKGALCARLYRLATEAAPVSADILLRWGDMLREAGNMKAAADAWKRAAATSCEPAAKVAAQHVDRLLDAATRYRFWRQLRDEKMTGPSQDDVRVRYGPACCFLHIHYASALADMGREDEALVLLDEVLEHNPDDTQARLQRGVARCQRGDVDGGLQDIHIALRGKPQGAHDAVARLESLVETMLTQGQYSQAEAITDFLRKKNPDNPLYLFFLGKAFLARHCYEEAVDLLKQVLLQAPESPRSARLLDEAYCHLGAEDERHRAWQEIVDAHPNAEVPRAHLQMMNE